MAMFETQELAADLGLPLTVESEAITLGGTSEVVVASEAGTYSCADVWFNVASSWIPRVTVRLYARLGASRVLVRQVTLSAAPTTTGGDGSLSGIAISLRGRPCTAFEVTCQATAGAVLTGGLFYLQAWHSHAEPSTSGGADVPETPTAVPMLAAAMVARNESTGDLTEVATDSLGRLIVTSPFFDSIDKQRLEDATADAATGALALRDSGGGSKFTSVTSTPRASIAASSSATPRCAPARSTERPSSRSTGSPRQRPELARRPP